MSQRKVSAVSGSRIRKFWLDRWTTYIWLLYLPVNMINYLPTRHWTDWWWLGLTGVFLIDYILVIELPWSRWVSIPGELGIAGMFCLLDSNYFMMIYPAWQLGSLLAYGSKRSYHWFLISYYGILGGSVLHDLLTTPKFSWVQSGALLGLFSLIVSPVFAYTIARSTWRALQLHQTNRRLEAIVQRGERERIARDLHDTLGQSFSMITLKTELAQKLLTKAPEQVSHELADIATTSRQNLQLVRSIVNDLHQQSLSETLITENRNLVAAGVILETQGESTANQWPTQAQGRLGAVLIEAVTNVIRHAHASRVMISFQQTTHTYQMTISDDGRGGRLFREGSNGVTGMTTRMTEVGGTLSMTVTHRGTQIYATLPKEG